jgi:hypothetical protein
VPHPHDHDGVLVDAIAKVAGASAEGRHQVTEPLVFDRTSQLGPVSQHGRGLPDAKGCAGVTPRLVGVLSGIAWLHVPSLGRLEANREIARERRKTPGGDW